MALREIHCQLQLESFDGTTLSVASLDATEALDSFHQVVVEAVTESPFDPSELIGQTASAIVSLGGQGDERAFHGYLFDASIKTLLDDRYLVRLVIKARLALLGLGLNSRIFQDQSVPDIVTTILDEAGLGDGYEWATTGTYQPRPYVVQSNESDLDFIARLVADEGIGFALRNEADADRVVFFDDSGSLPEIEGETTLIDSATSMVDVNVVIGSHDVHRATSDAAMLRDYDFQRPSTDLSAEAEGSESQGRQVYVHPGSYREVSVGQDRTDFTLESLAGESRTLEGDSDCPRLEPGRRFTLLNHGHAGTDGELLVRSVTHRVRLHTAGDRPSTYLNTFTALPADVPHRPPISLARPHPGGVQNAFVTTPSGGEIHSDEWGRVKVRFPWDRSGITDDTSSTWLRVGQYPLGGSMTIPRGGFEVLVDFELGDIDRPYVLSHLYNGEAPPPYALPDHAVRSSFQTATTEGGAGANELRFDDTAGSEEIFLNASHDYLTSIANDANSEIGNNETYEVGSNRSLGITVDHNEEIAANETIDIGANQTVTVAGNYSTGAGGSQTVTVGAVRKLTVGGDHTESVAGSLTRDVGAMQSITGIAGCQRKVVGDCTTTVGAAWGEVVGQSRMVSVGGSFSEKVGALKMIKAKTVGVSAGAAYAMTAAAEKVKAGGGRTDTAKGAVALSAGGGIKVKAGADIVFTAGSKLVFRGGAITMTLKSSGQIHIKAPTVKVKNADVLTQAMHQSG